MSKSPAGRTSNLVLVLAADADDYVAWCRARDRQPFATTAWAITQWTGSMWHGSRRTFQVTDRWRENTSNRRLLAELRKQGVLYGDEHGAWPSERVPDLSWPTRWQRIRTRIAGRSAAA